jgi:hypothetical protein
MVRDTSLEPATSFHAKHAGPIITAATLVVEAFSKLPDDEELAKSEQYLRRVLALKCPGHYSQANSLSD